jgi:hypothetical protein
MAGVYAYIDADSLARKSELSPTINFTAAVPHFEEMFDIVRQLNDRDISRLSTQQLDQVTTGQGPGKRSGALNQRLHATAEPRETGA